MSKVIPIVEMLAEQKYAKFCKTRYVLVKRNELSILRDCVYISNGKGLLNHVLRSSPQEFRSMPKSAI